MNTQNTRGKDPAHLSNSLRNEPDQTGCFGDFGGCFVAETLMPLVIELASAYQESVDDPEFQAELRGHQTQYIGRPSPLYPAKRLSQHFGGASIFFKRDELNHTGSHKINNTLAQVLLAKRMGKRRIITETGAGQNGVAVATVCARFDLPCVVFMGAKDMIRQAPNVVRMKMLGAEIRAVDKGAGTLKDALNEALRDWVTNVDDTYYVLGTAAGPHPYPKMVRDFQSIIGREVREQLHEQTGRLPDILIACVGGGSNALGLFHPFLDDGSVKLIAVEAGGYGLHDPDGHAAPLCAGQPGILHGARSYVLQNSDGQIREGHSISAGLDYPGVGPELAWLRDNGRIQFVHSTDDEALAAFQLCARLEGIIPALEPAHALAYVAHEAPRHDSDTLIVLNLCGRGDKDVFEVDQLLSGSGDAEC